MSSTKLPLFVVLKLDGFCHDHESVMKMMFVEMMSLATIWIAKILCHFLSTMASSSSFLPIKASEAVKLLGMIPHPEGGFFLETFRSGVAPMSTRGTTPQTAAVPARDLVTTTGREDRSTDTRRSCLTSIYWMPTLQSPCLFLCVNLSDHVHYYHGGKPFEYLLYDPSAENKRLERIILGPDIANGHQLQVCVPGGTYKCGRLLLSSLDERLPHEYCLLGEAVGPGFDICDFRPLTTKDLEDTVGDPAERAELAKYLFTENSGDMQFDGFYNDDELQKARTQARS